MCLSGGRYSKPYSGKVLLLQVFQRTLTVKASLPTVSHRAVLVSTPLFMWKSGPPKVLCALVILRECVAGARTNMVYCTKCGTNNVEDATVCVHCGTALYGASGEGRTYWGYGHYEREYGFHRRSAAIVVIAIGLIIIFAGFSLLVSELYGIDIPWGPVIMILIGIFVLLRLFQVRNRRR
jgi:hypothetical protein